MKVAALTRAQYTALRTPLDVIDAALATRASKIGRRVPPGKRPPETYEKGARGWSAQATEYPQSTGAMVLTISEEGWEKLNPAHQQIFDDLKEDARGNPIYPEGFQQGTVAEGAKPPRLPERKPPRETTGNGRER